jgi:hypothetical protein
VGECGRPVAVRFQIGKRLNFPTIPLNGQLKLAATAATCEDGTYGESARFNFSAKWVRWAKWILSGWALPGHPNQLTAPDSLKQIGQFYAKCTTILDNGGSLNFLSHRFGVMLVKQVIEAGRKPQFSQKIFGIERGIGQE